MIQNLGFSILSLLLMSTFAHAGSLRCIGSSMVDGKLTDPPMDILIETTADRSQQNVTIYKTNSNKVRTEWGKGVLTGRLAILEECPIVLTLENGSRFEGTLMRGKELWSNSLGLAGESEDGAELGGFFMGCGNLRN